VVGSIRASYRTTGETVSPGSAAVLKRRASKKRGGGGHAAGDKAERWSETGTAVPIISSRT
jgi:hypothetical protein